MGKATPPTLQGHPEAQRKMDRAPGLGTQSHPIINRRAKAIGLHTDGAISCPPFFPALAQDPSGRELLRSDTAIWQGQEEVWASNMSAPEPGRQEVSPVRAADEEGPDPARTLLCVHCCLSPHSESIRPRFLLEEQGAS